MCDLRAMPYTLPNVSSGLWCGSVLAPGTVLTGIDVYKQRCYVVLNTPLGSDPLRPLFGCDWFKYIDSNQISAAAKIKKEIIDAITIWVTEVKISKITYTSGVGKLVFTIRLKVDGETFQISFSPSRGGLFSGVSGVKIINKEMPWNTKHATLALTVDGVAASPSIPGVPTWTDVAGLMAWVRANWGVYATWGFSREEIIMYLKAPYRDAAIGVTKLG